MFTKKGKINNDNNFSRHKYNIPSDRLASAKVTVGYARACVKRVTYLLPKKSC